MKVKVESLSHVRLFATLWTVAHQAPQSMEFFRQEYWSGSPLPSPVLCRQRIKKQRHYFAYEGPFSQSYGFSSRHLRMWELDHKEGWMPKNWCFWTVVLEKTLESPLDCKEIKTVNSKRNQPWIFTGRTDAEAETPVLWPLDVKSWLIGKDPHAGKDRRQEKGATVDEIVGWHHRLIGHEFEQILGDRTGKPGVACCSPWGDKESNTT